MYMVTYPYLVINSQTNSGELNPYYADTVKVLENADLTVYILVFMQC